MTGVTGASKNMPTLRQPLLCALPIKLPPTKATLTVFLAITSPS